MTPQAPWTGSGCREYPYGGFGGGHPHFHPHAIPAGNPRIKGRAHPCRESSQSVRSFGLAWVFALAAVYRDPAPSGGIAARVAASVPMAARPDRICSPGRGSPGHFKLDQRVRSVCPGRRRTVLDCNLGLSAWKSVPFRHSSGLTWSTDCPPGTVRDPSLPGGNGRNGTRILVALKR